MIINQNILATLKTFSNLQKKIMQNVTPKRQLPKLLLHHFLEKFLTEEKCIMNNLIFASRKPLHEIKKYINSQTKNKSRCNNGLQPGFYKRF